MNIGRNSLLAVFLLATRRYSQPNQDLLNSWIRDLLRESLSGELAKVGVVIWK
jgi:hypothetical protein